MKSRRTVICIHHACPRPRQGPPPWGVFQLSLIPLQFSALLRVSHSTLPYGDLIVPYFGVLVYASPLSQDDIDQLAARESD